jgi:hypothetical protein
MNENIAEIEYELAIVSEIKHVSRDMLDGIRHSVEIVDIFADFWLPPVSGAIEDRFEILVL